MENLSNESKQTDFGYLESKSNKTKKIIFSIFGVILFFLVFYYLFFSAPGNFVPGTVVRVDAGMSLHSISLILEKEHVIRSRTAFESFIIILGGEKHIVAADYLFQEKLSVWSVAKRIEGREYNKAPVAVSIPEGFNVEQIAEAFSLKLNKFNKDKFIEKAINSEGYLFPDTYFFLTNADEDDVLKSMSDTFKKKISPILPEIISKGKTEKDIIIMASIIERESKGDIDRKVISGILWKRIKIGMPLQVDAAMNTYKEKGLPERPICNPGMKAIEAAIYPETSSYLYYLHDKEGGVHYAKTFTEHIKNKLKYLK